MAFWGTIGETFTTKSKVVAEKAKGIADIASLKGQMVSYETAINKSFREMGEAYYEAHKDDVVDCEFQEMVIAVKEAKAILDEMQDKIRELKGTTICQVCGVSIPEDSCFCLKCGAKVEKKVEPETGDEEDIFVDEDMVEEAEIVLEEVVVEAE